MANIIIPTYEGPVIRVGGICYRFSRFTQNTPTQNGGHPVYSTCEACIVAKDLSSSSEASTSSNICQNLAGESVTVTDSRSTYLDEFNPQINYGAAWYTEFIVSNARPISVARRGLIEFNIPYNPCPCRSAKLFLYCSWAAKPSPNIVEVSRVVRPWLFYEATWEQADWQNAWTIEGCQCFDPFGCGVPPRGIDHAFPPMGSADVLQGGYNEFVLDPIVVNEWLVNPASNRGMVLVQWGAPSQAFVTRFYSSNHANAFWHPYLLLEW